MTRRASLPGAAELFRATAPGRPEPEPVPPMHPGVGAVPAPSPGHVDEPVRLSQAPRALRTSRRARGADRSPSGRERHEEKITVYCSPEELLDLETARLHLRAEHGIAIDRGRIVREALAVILADLEAQGESSILVRRLRQL